MALLLMTAGLPAGHALDQTHPAVVSDNPADTAPNVVDGKVTAILPMGNRIYVGGSTNRSPAWCRSATAT